MCSSSTTTTNKTAPLSAKGRSYESLYEGMLMQNLDQQGYDVVPSEKTEYTDPDKAKQYEDQITKYNNRLSSLDNQIAKRDADNAKKGYALNGKFDPLQQERQNVQSQLDSTQGKYDKLEKVTYTDYAVKQKADPRVQAIWDKYGIDPNDPKAMQNRDYQKAAQEVKVSTQQFAENDQQKAADLEFVQKKFLENVKKYVSGDMSYTEDQRKQVDQYIAPVKDMIVNFANDTLSKIGDDTKELTNYLNNVGQEIDRTGFAVGDALKAAGIQIDQTGDDLLSTLKKVNESTSAKFKFQQDLLFQQIDEQAATQAAFLGLPPGSQSEVVQKAKMKNDVMQSLALQLNEQEMQGELGVKQYIGEDKKRISLANVALAESQGGKKETLAGQTFDFMAGQRGKETDVVAARGNALLALEQTRQAQLQNAAFGGLPNLISAASGGLSFESNQKAADQNQFAAAIAPVGQQLSVEQQRQFAETTQHTQSNPGFLSSLGSLFGVGAAGAGAVMGGIGAMNGGGGGAPAPVAQGVAPIQLSYGGGSSYYPTAQPSRFSLGVG